MTLYISHMLTEDMLAQVSKLQYTNVTLLADHLDEEFLDRLSNLKERARIIHQEDIADPELLNRRLQKEAVFLRHFNGGAFITDIEGTAIASFPVSAGRIGVNYMFRDQIASALKEGKSAVSRVVVGKQLHAPVVSMATPVRDKQGTIVGALVGTINLAQPNFLDKVSNSDYGDTGGYLKQLPLDQLKIDQSFVHDMTIDSNDAVMVQTIIDLAKNFRVNVIAEGVETEEQLSLLKHQGCLTYQGYLFSKPVPIDQFEALLKP